MFDSINLPLILFAAFLTTASPGPATLAIAGTSMSGGRRKGLAMAAGITTGSWIWSISAALGLGTLMLANAWAFETIRYLGACYLLFLAYKSARSALASHPASIGTNACAQTLRSAYSHGLGLHVTNPKAILFFGALFSIGVPPGTPALALAGVIACVGLQSFIIFHGYAILFSSTGMIRRYQQLRRWFESAFAVAFGIAGIKVLTTRLSLPD